MMKYIFRPKICKVLLKTGIFLNPLMFHVEFVSKKVREVVVGLVARTDTNEKND